MNSHPRARRRPRQVRKPLTRRLVLRSAALLCLLAIIAHAYPLDGYPRTGIARLLAFRLMQEGKLKGNVKLPPGALLPSSEIQLRLKGTNETFDITPQTSRDLHLQAGIERIFAGRDPSYSLALLEITDPRQPRYAALRPDQTLLPGSVGKLLVMTGLFQALARAFPEIADRERVLKQTLVTADKFILSDSHPIPIYREGDAGVLSRIPKIGDRFSLWEWVDHMVSPSSNSCAAMVWKQAMLLNRFGKAYPPPAADEGAFFENTPKTELARLGLAVTEEPLVAAGLDAQKIRQGTFFTDTGSRIVPGSGSYASPKELLRWMIRLEQGRLVDSWSSLEMKKLIYFTRRRYRYAAAPALDKAAVFFKSGSKFECRPEPGYQCGQYRGNAENIMNSVAIVESPAARADKKVYLVAMMSNVLKVNSASEHATIAALMERLIQERDRK